ncbi:hypothetical protein [Planobispora rosea]|uniref:hypothetical protein n=1 Tax=Planobispora rosea TaxID=35762 RepID=UPI00083AC81E|nr:hypothetical protein [Planobispora rosea]
MYTRISEWPRETVEYLSVIIEGDDNLATYTVAMQVLPHGTRPAAGAWQAAAWDTDQSGNTIAKVLIGPGTSFDFSAAPGVVVPWVKITALPEVPVLEGDPIRIT